jgi:hypothetical protein
MIGYDRKMSETPPNHPDPGWHIRTLRPKFPWIAKQLLPAEVSAGLVAAMLARESILEDVQYRKIVPNHFIVEINRNNYLLNFQGIEKRIIQQWKEKMMEELLTANSRHGRKEYHFGGRLQIEIRPAEDLEPKQARILSRIQANGDRQVLKPAQPQACLEIYPGGRRWLLRPGIMTIGRKPVSDIYLDMPEIQERRLISGQHAYILSKQGQSILYDGSPDGKASVNGTYVNYQRVIATGQALREGDLIILASVDPDNPRPDTPGACSFYFRSNCP